MSETHTVRGARRAMILVVIGSLAVAAVIGIVILVDGGLAETERDVLLTALTVAGFATTALCHLVVVTRTVRALGVVGLSAGVGAAVCALVLIWSDDRGESAQTVLLEAFAVLAVVAVSLAHTTLLLLACRGARRSHPAVRAALVVTLLAITTVAVMLVVPTLAEDWFADPYGRLFGVAVIVDALGTIAVPVLALVLRRADVVATVRLHLDLPPDLAARLDARTGAVTRESVALDALDRAL